ncbi:MAG TPA: hypothetical protein VEC02_00865 [Nitrososphaerales archaeon]|nr:hypothetical protein [Nitrososphaerales archaeon]
MAVGRFQIMALLQAARARVLGLPLESSLSWGLNRAIFIAAAKKGFKGGSGGEGGAGRGGSIGTAKAAGVYYLGDDMAFKDEEGGVLCFTIGGKVQTKEDYDRQVKARFGRAYADAWREALAYVKTFDKETLLSAERFFGDVYRPKRDELADKWTETSKGSAQS